MNSRVYLGFCHGLGDRLLDFIGIYIITKYFGFHLHAEFERECGWGYYDKRLFKFDDIPMLTIVNKIQPGVNEYVPGGVYYPINVYDHLKQFIPTLTFRDVSKMYSHVAKQLIQPSDIILNKLPQGLENAYGIHLRYTDRVLDHLNERTVRFMTSPQELSMIINSLFEHVKRITETESNPSFVIVGENETWCDNIKGKLKKTFPSINIIEVDYSGGEEYRNFSSVLDMFCLSRCKQILQGIKYSSYSVVASLIGTQKLSNYANKFPYYCICDTNLWSSIIQINDKQNHDECYHRTLCKYSPQIKCNFSEAELLNTRHKTLNYSISGNIIVTLND